MKKSTKEMIQAGIAGLVMGAVFYLGLAIGVGG